MNLDDYKNGLFDSNSPINQIETDYETVEPTPTYENLTSAYYSGFEDAFLDTQIEILHELNVILETSKAIDFGMVSRIKRLINKCK